MKLGQLLKDFYDKIFTSCIPSHDQPITSRYQGGKVHNSELRNYGASLTFD